MTAFALGLTDSSVSVPVTSAASGSLASQRILHVFRAPVGGLFRHVVDLARLQAAAGHGSGSSATPPRGASAPPGPWPTSRPV